MGLEELQNVCNHFYVFSVLTHVGDRYFTKFESYGLNEKNPNVDLDQRGTNGPVRVGYFGGVHDTSLAFVKTCEAIGIPSSPDFNVVEGQKGVNRVRSQPHFIPSSHGDINLR